MTLKLTPPETDRPEDRDPDSETESASEPPAEQGSVVELPTQQGTARLQLPFDANDSEAAAVAAAVAAHLSASEESEDSAESVDRWKLAERFGSRRAARLPVDCSPGDAWKLSGRCQQSW